MKNKDASVSGVAYTVQRTRWCNCHKDCVRTDDKAHCMKNKVYNMQCSLAICHAHPVTYFWLKMHQFCFRIHRVMRQITNLAEMSSARNSPRVYTVHVIMQNKLGISIPLCLHYVSWRHTACSPVALVIAEVFLHKRAPKTMQFTL